MSNSVCVQQYNGTSNSVYISTMVYQTLCTSVRWHIKLCMCTTVRWYVKLCVQQYTGMPNYVCNSTPVCQTLCTTVRRYAKLCVQQYTGMPNCVSNSQYTRDVEYLKQTSLRLLSLPATSLPSQNESTILNSVTAELALRTTWL